MLSIILNIITIALVILFGLTYGRSHTVNTISENTPPWYWTASDALDANVSLVDRRRIY
jgi:hypothetical protein